MPSGVSRNEEWFLTGVYGHLKVPMGNETRALIKRLKKLEQKAWLILGDFNEVLHLSEKWGEWGDRDHSEKQMNDFCQALANCELKDLGFKGSRYI